MNYKLRLKDDGEVGVGSATYGQRLLATLMILKEEFDSLCFDTFYGARFEAEAEGKTEAEIEAEIEDCFHSTQLNYDRHVDVKVLINILEDQIKLHFGDRGYINCDVNDENIKKLKEDYLEKMMASAKSKAKLN